MAAGVEALNTAGLPVADIDIVFAIDRQTSGIGEKARPGASATKTGDHRRNYARQEHPSTAQSDNR